MLSFKLHPQSAYESINNGLRPYQLSSPFKDLVLLYLTTSEIKEVMLGGVSGDWEKTQNTKELYQSGISTQRKFNKDKDQDKVWHSDLKTT